jgi:ABC-type glycerol-3-phosphate transport system permease component
MSVTLAALQSERGAEFGNIAAFSCIAAVPLFILILFAQKNLVRGMTFGAIKG